MFRPMLKTVIKTANHCIISFHFSPKFKDERILKMRSPLYIITIEVSGENRQASAYMYENLRIFSKEASKQCVPRKIRKENYILFIYIT
jgi:hypothetical protein